MCDRSPTHTNVLHARPLVVAVAAVLVAGSALAANPDWEEAMAAFEAGSFEAAAGRFAKIIQADPDAHAAYYMMGRCYSGLGRRVEAIANLEKANTLQRGDASYALALGKELLSDGQYQRAHTLLVGLTRDDLEPADRGLLDLLRVQAAIKSGRRSEAVTLAEALVKADPDRAANHRALGAALDAAGRRGEAIEALTRAFELDPSDSASAVAAIQRAASMAKRSESEDQQRQLYRTAASIAERLAEREPSAENLLRAGEMWLGARAPERALAWFERATASRPDDPLGLYYLGSCLAAADREDEAVRRLNEALGQGPDEATRISIHGLLGALHAGRMELALAQEHYRAAGNAARAEELARLADDVAELVRRRDQIDQELASLERIIASFEELGEDQGSGVVRQRMATLRLEQAEIDRELERVRRALD